MSQCSAELARGFGQIQTPPVAFIVQVDVSLGHGVACSIAREGKTVVFVAERPFGALHIRVSTVVGPDRGGAECGDVAVVGEVLVHHSHIVGGQCIGAVGGVSRERLEHADARARRGSATEFGGIEELSFGSDSAAVKQSALVEKVGPFEKEGTVLVELHFEGAQVEHEVVRDHLAKIRNQRHVDGEGIADAHFGIQPAIDRRRPLTFACIVHRCGAVRADVGEQRDARRCIDAFDAAKNPTLVDHALHGWIQGIPDRFLARTTHRSPNVHAPNLFHAARKAWHPKLAPRHPNFSGPPALVDLAFDFPNAVPSVIRALGIHDEVVQCTPRCGAEAHGVDAVVVRAEPDAKFV